MRFQDINRGSLEYLLKYADSFGEDGPLLHSRDVLSIVKADLLDFEGIPLDKILTETENNYYMFLVGGLFYNKTSIPYYRTFFEDLGVNTKRFSDITLKNTFYEYIYKNNLELPNSFLYDSTVLSAPAYIYNIPDYNWENIIPYPMTREYLMKIIYRDYSLMGTVDIFKPLEVLVYQTDEHLLEIIRNIPILADNFPKNSEAINRRFMINFISYFSIPISSQILNFTKNYHNPDGNRETRVALFLENNHRFFEIFRSRNYKIESILSYPPYWFEKDLIEGKIKIKADDADQISLSISDLIESENTDPNLPILSHNEIGALIEKRDPILSYYSREKILYSAGYNDVTNFIDKTCNNILLIDKIKGRFNIFRFDLNTKTDYCEDNRDIMTLEPYEGFVITYGTYFNLSCMSPEDLIFAFSPDSDEEITFRDPKSRGRIFTTDEIMQLNKLLSEQNPDTLPRFNARVEDLKIAIGNGIKVGYSVEKAAAIFKKLINNPTEQNVENINNFKNFLLHVFNAGMYQRLWGGPGYPYPYKNWETRGSCQSEIDNKMNPELSEAFTFLKKMTPSFRRHVDELRTVYSLKQIGNDVIDITISAYRFVEMLEMTIGIRNDSGELLPTPALHGNFCVGAGSNMMILSAYNYLRMIGYNIPDFNPNLLESSTHRM